MGNAITEKLKNSFVFFDGGLGTQLQENGLNVGEAPEAFLMRCPDGVQKVHENYKNAGAGVITTCTFGANRLKLAPLGLSAEDVIKTATEIAKRVAGDDILVALDIGPLGELCEPIGTLKTETAYEIFKEQAIWGEKYGADFILIETMTDLAEARIAALAAKENTSLPVICTMSFEEGGRTFTGCKVSSFALTLSPLVDAVGINCSLGPKEILPMIEELIKYTNLPVVAQPNAGLPQSAGGKAVYDVSADEFADTMHSFALAGVTGLGGCCGTTPEYIKKMKETITFAPRQREKVSVSAVCTSSNTVHLDGCRVIGERINPTGKKRFKEALKNRDIDYILGQAIEQAEAGADILDVNVGLPEIDEAELSRTVVTRIQSIMDLPLQIDSSDPAVIESSLRAYVGKAIVNSVNGEQKVLDAVLPIVKKYGAAVVALTLDENGIPSSAEERKKIAERIVLEAEKHGIGRENIIVDCLTLTVSAQQAEAAETLKAVRMVREELGVKTVLGVSNISFGLPQRNIINEAFLAQALAMGLDMAIINPNADGMMRMIYAHRVLANIDKGAEGYIEKYGQAIESTKPADSSEMTLDDIIIKGLKSAATEATKKLIQSKGELEIVNEHIIPALDTVGERYEKGTVFLPQLINSAETVKYAFEVIRENLASSGSNINRGSIILATVKGDIHDIGKNIVKVILENYGFSIIDLGRNVPPETVVNCAKEKGVKLVGLSALMTTTVKSMEDTIKALYEECPETKIMVGGAVLTEDYAEQIGAHFYAKDAKQAVEIAKKVFE